MRERANNTSVRKIVQGTPMCEAPYHVPDCSGYGTTIDHFTPRCVAKTLGWTNYQLSHKDNLQYLSPECHASKDASTPARLRQLQWQLRGGSIKIGRHIG